MNDRHILSIRTSVAAVPTEFAWAEGRDERSCAIQSTVTVSGVACDQFVWITTEVDARFADEIEKGELVICSICEYIARFRACICELFYLLARRRRC